MDSHGIDSLNCTLASLLGTAAMGFGPTKAGAFMAMVPCLPMFFSTWETYHTHTLYLGYFNGPTEGLLIAASTMALSGFFGPQVWGQPASDVFGFSNFFGDFVLRDLWAPIMLGAFFTAHLPGCVKHVVQARRKADLPVLPVFLEWTPMLIFCGSCIAWLGSPQSCLLPDNHLVLFCLTMSLVFGRLTTKIILHHLTRQSFPYFTVMLLPLIGGAVLTNLEYFGFAFIEPKYEVLYLQAYYIFALIVYSNWAWRVIDTICRFLDIHCLTIKKAKPEKSGASKAIPSLQGVGNSIDESKKEI